MAMELTGVGYGPCLRNIKPGAGGGYGAVESYGAAWGWLWSWLGVTMEALELTGGRTLFLEWVLHIGWAGGDVSLGNGIAGSGCSQFGSTWFHLVSPGTQVGAKPN